MSAQTVPQGEQRTVALTEIEVEQGFNPRDRFERKALDELAKSIAIHGLLQPLVVAEQAGGYRLIAGERRFRAAQLAGVEQVPVLVRQPEGSSGFELAIVENIERVQLDPVEEAKAYRRLMSEQGLTRKGVSERLGIAQKRVTERLQILELPEQLHPRLSAGEIPPAAVRALVQLAKLHPELPAVAVAQVEREVDRWEEPVTWRDVASDALAVVAQASSAELPSDVYEAWGEYPLERFSLTDEAGKDLDKLGKLGFEIGHVRFEQEEHEQAEALGALHGSLIVGQDVADQLACDRIRRALKEARAWQRRQREWERKRAQQAEANGDDPSGDGGSESAPSEEELAEQRRGEREAKREAKRKAAAHNAELGAAVVKGFAKVKLDERVVKILATLNLGGELEQLAMRGARYGFPGWVEQTATKGGRPKTVYIEQRAEAGVKAREYLSVAKTPTEVAGRLLALVAMARYADEAAVADSAGSFYRLPVPRELPWGEQIVDLIDELAAERLPDHLTAAKREQRAEQREQEAERERMRRSVEQRLERGADLSPQERAQLRDELEAAYAPYSPQFWDASRRLDELDRDAKDMDERDQGSPDQSEQDAEEVTAEAP